MSSAAAAQKRRKRGAAAQVRDDAKDAEEQAELAYEYSGNRSVLNQLVYDIPQQQQDVESCHFITKLPSTTLPIYDGDGTLEFYHEPSSGYAISLYDSFFSFTLQVTHQDGSALVEDERVNIIAYPLNTIWKRVAISINNQPVTLSTSQNHAIESYIAALSHLSDSTKKFNLSAALFKIDTEETAQNIDEGWPSLLQGTNFRERIHAIQKSKPLVLVGRILHELMLSPSLLPEMTEVRVSMQMQPSNWILMSEPGKQYRVSVTDAKMYVALFKLTPQALSMQHRLLSNGGGGLTYTFPRWDTRVIQVPANLTLLTPEIFRGRAPDRLIVLFLRQDAYTNTAPNLNALHLRPMGMSSLQVFFNSVGKPAIPYSVKYDVKTDKPSAELAYYMLQRESNVTSSALSFTQDEYVRGVFFCIIDLSRDHSSGLRSSYLSSAADCSITMDLRFEEPLPEPIVVVCIHEHVAFMKLTADKKVETVI